jgi:hypothetical protein
VLHVLPANCVFSRVGLPGLEPGTSSLSEKRSNRLSYRPFDSPPLRAVSPSGIVHHEEWPIEAYLCGED